MGYKSRQLWTESCFRLKVHSQTWFRIACQFVLHCLEILTLSNMLTSLKWIVKVFSNLLTIDEDKHRISDHNYLIKVLQTCLWTPLIFCERPNYQTLLSMFYMIFRPLEVGVWKKKEKKKERKKEKKRMDVRCQNTSSRVWHITSILLLGAWISDETPFLIFDILSQGWEMLHLLRKRRKKKKKLKLV